MSTLRGEDVETRRIYFLFDFPNIAKTCASVKHQVLLNELIDWNQLRRRLKEHVHANYPGNLPTEFVVFVNRRSAKQSRGRIKSLRKSGFRVVVRRNDDQSVGVAKVIFEYVKQILQKPDTAAIYVLGNDLDSVELISSYMIDPVSEIQDDGLYHRVYDGETDLWVGIIPSGFDQYTNLDRFVDSVRILNLEELSGVFFGSNVSHSF